MKPRIYSARFSLQRQALFAYHNYSTTASKSSAAVTDSLNSRWLHDLRARIGRCIQFGLSTRAIERSGSILQELTQNWRELVAGSEGFLTDKSRRGLYRQEVVWGEMDSMAKHIYKGHVNNVTYNRYAESARINWAQRFAQHIDPAHCKEWSELWTPIGTGLILRSIKTDFKFPMKWPDRVTVYHKLRHLPSESTDSFILDVVILSEVHRRIAARCVEDIVVYDYRKGKKAPLQPFIVRSFRETFELQERAKQQYGARIMSLIEEVKQLEKESWDRPDAKEDLGGSH